MFHTNTFLELMADTNWVCFESIGVEYKIFAATPLSFEGAKTACEGEGATLGRVSSFGEFVRVLELGDTLQEAEQVWIGVEVDKGKNEDNAENYIYVDEFENIEFFDTARGRFPWGKRPAQQ